MVVLKQNKGRQKLQIAPKQIAKCKKLNSNMRESHQESQFCDND